MLMRQPAADSTTAQPSSSVRIMSLDSGRKLVTYLIDQAVAGLVHVAAVSSALYVFTQLLPEENMVLENFVYDAQHPLETSENGRLFKCADCTCVKRPANPTHNCLLVVIKACHSEGSA